MQEMNEVPSVNVGDQVTGKVVKVEDKQILVDINQKTEGIVPISEISNVHVETMSDVVSEGDELQLQVKKVDDDEIILSKKAVDAEKAWQDLEEKFNNEETFETEVKEIVKGGLVVDIGVRGFIPASLVETYYVDDFSSYLNETLTVKIVDFDKEQNRVILSHRAVTEQEERLQKINRLTELNKGDVIDGVVQRLTSFGAFVDIGGVDGLVHISELAHEHVENASDVVAEGDEIKVEVLSVDKETERVSLSRKNVLPGPWTDIASKIKQDDVVEGTVKRLVNFGAFVELLPGVEGLVHISQIANRHIGTPDEVLEENQQVKVKVLSVDEDEKRISLSIKELEADEVAADIKEYEKSDDDSSFQLGDLIGDKLNKYKDE